MSAGAPLLPQLTLRAVVLGLVLSAVLAGANAYLGLFAGMTVAASIPASVISMAVLKVFRDTNILEHNSVQTIASAGEALAAGTIFTFPALVILGYWNTFDYLWVTVIAGLGGLLGVLFTIPLRRSLIVEQQLAFPEGTATAEVLKLGGAAGGARHLAWAAAAGALIKLTQTGLRLWPETAQLAGYLGSRAIGYVGTNLSPALLGVGYIVGLNIAMLVFIGGAISWWVAIPIYSGLFLDHDPELAAQLASGAGAADLANAIWGRQIRYLGVGAMLVGGVWALISIRKSLWSGIRSGLRAARRPTDAGYDHTDHDAPMKVVLLCTVLFVIPIFGLYFAIVGTLGVALAMTVVMLITGFLFSSVAGYMTGLVGSSNNPLSGITIATVLLTAALLAVLLGRDAANGAAAAVLVGAVVCCAAAIGGDTLQDLKAGYLLGATPWRQQLGQALGVVSAVLVMAPILNVLVAAYGIGAPSPEHPASLPAPQANLMASVARGVFGGGLPWGMIAVGALVGTAIIALDEYLARRGAAWRAPVLAVAVGIYLPLELATPILAGGLIAHFAARRNPLADAGARPGVLFAAGLITGEALVGIVMAIPIVLSGKPDLIALGVTVPAGVGLLAVGGVAVALYRVASARENAA
ncbi:MAG TPA: oligopeptide transporter, OPT family [Gammaproteobacteria bacterium]|nr:oligopeptide transporter, OPT family [Gammaproteobacteria bacterium]